MAFLTGIAQRFQRASQSAQAVPREVMIPRLMVIISVALLCIIGILMIYSASSILSLEKFGSSTHYVLNQVKFGIIGVILALIISRTPYEVYKSSWVWVFWGITTILLIYTSVKGIAGKGAERWVSVFGFTMQPSEFAKITVSLLTAQILTRFARHEIDFRNLVVLLFVAVFLPLIMILAQPDLGTTIIVTSTVVAMAYLTGLPLRYLVYVGVVMVALVLILILIEPYRLTRLMTLFNPWKDPQGDGYQIIQGLYAFGSGGLFGTGIGNSRQKFLYLPEAHTDFIFAIIGEELGLIGTLVVLALFFCLIYGGLRITSQAPDMIGQLLAGSMTVLLGVQSLINLMCVLAFIPVTGKPLPFLSYGGSSIITSLAIVGVLISVSRASATDVKGSSNTTRSSSRLKLFSVADEGSSSRGSSTSYRKKQSGTQSSSRTQSSRKRRS